MAILETIGKVLGGAVGGGLLGVVAQFAVGWLEVWRADKESVRRINELKAAAEARADAASWDAFTASQNASRPVGNEPSWVAGVLSLTRPVLTLLLLALAAGVYFTAAPEVRADVSGEILACAFGATWWWFGSRYQTRVRSQSTK